MKLYGVEHGQYVTFAGMHLADLEVEPSYELLEQLEDLPQSSKVGIEATPEVLSGEDLGGYSFTETSTAYWQPIVYTCNAQGHEIVWLDDMSLHHKTARFMIAASRLEQSFDDNSEQYDKVQEREIRELTYALGIAARYAHEVEREAAIFDKLASHKPDAAIIGKAHGDYLMLNRQVAEVPVDSYQQSRTDDFPMSTATLLDYLPRTPYAGRQYLVNGIPNTDVLDERESIDRRYTAVTQGRIQPGSSPAYIGSWSLQCRPGGLFEVYPATKDGTYSEGTIEDCLGSASYSGQFPRDYVEFTKEYRRVLETGAALMPLFYTSDEFSDGQYSGDYGMEQSSGHFRIFGRFVMTPGSVLYKPIDVENLDLNGLVELP